MPERMMSLRRHGSVPRYGAGGQINLLVNREAPLFDNPDQGAGERFTSADVKCTGDHLTGRAAERLAGLNQRELWWNR